MIRIAGEETEAIFILCRPFLKALEAKTFYLKIISEPNRGPEIVYSAIFWLNRARTNGNEPVS